MKYNAFISYRHAPLDMEIAKKVHTGLETYRIPKSVQKKLGIKKIKRVFRDQEELPIGSNLSDNIGEALKESEHLIVICSPRTPESEWVQKEIETFIKLHGRENVLAVLIEGEPNESFPELLLNDENGNPVEPLAADVRGETAKERNKKFKTEILRLVAPVIGCNYDDLRQRHRERVVKRTISLVSAAAGIIALAGITFGLYHADVAAKMTNLANEKAQLADEKTQLADEILQEYRLKQENQSRFLAKEAINLYNEGNREDAALVAIAALPGEGNDRPYVAEAENALGCILHVYDTGSSMSFDRTLKHDLIVSKEKLSNDGTHLITKDSGNTIYAWDAETWELVTKIPPAINDYNYRVTVDDFFADETGIYLVGDQFFAKYGFDGEKIYEYIPDGLYIRGAEISNIRNTAYIMAANVIISLDLTKGTEISTVEMPVAGSFASKHKISAGGGYLISTYMLDNSDEVEIACYNLEKNAFNLTKLSEGDVLDFCYTPLGNLAVLTCNADFIKAGVKDIYLDLINPETGNIIWYREVPATVNYLATFCVNIKAHSYTIDDNETFSELVITIEDEAFTINELNSKLVTSLSLGDCATTLDVRSDNYFGFVGYENGNIDTINFHEGRIYSDNVIKTGYDITQLVIMNGKVAVRPIRSSVIKILKYHTGEDVKEIAETKYINTLICDPHGADYFMYRSEQEGGLHRVMSKTGEELLTIEQNNSYPCVAALRNGKAIVISYDTIYIGDIKTGKVEETTAEELGLTDKFYHGYLTDNGRYVLIRDYHNVTVVDLVEKKVIYRTNSDKFIDNAVISEDGKTLLVAARELNLLKIDTATGEQTLFDCDELQQTSDLLDLQYVVISPDGKTAAMCCKDGNVRLINVSDGKILDVIPFNAKSHCSLYFTIDNKVLIMQGDDFTIKFRDIEAKAYIDSFDASYEIKQIVQSDDGYIGICDIAHYFLIEPENFGICAQVTEGAAYIPSDKTFIISSSGTLYSVPFKDYKALIEEAKKQFPGAELTTEEKVKYNIN